VLVISSCQKEYEIKGKLTTFSDNDYRYSVSYNGNNVNEILVDSGTNAPFIIAKYSYQGNLIRADLHASTGYTHVDYYMKNASLPLRIEKYIASGGSEQLIQRVNFYYRNNSDVPDSVVLDGTTHFRFVPVFNNGNITDYYVSTNNGPEVLSGNFLYYPLENVFRATNPLLFIYSSPVFQFETFLMPRLFSANTLKKFNGGSFVYDTDAKGNLSLEDYGIFFPYRRLYTYR